MSVDAAVVAFVGNPNVGKSALFGALTGAYATVSNYPGTTVELLRSSARLSGGAVEVVDTPGILSLFALTEDERVTRDLVLGDHAPTIVVVGDAKNVVRTLSLALQVAELGRPFVVCLNMIDEAHAAGLRLDAARLERLLGVPVCATVATSGEGLPALRDALPRAARSGMRVGYPWPIEQALRAMDPPLPRAHALLALAGDPRFAGLRARVEARLGTSVAHAVAVARDRGARALCEAVSGRAASHERASALAQRLDRLAMHPRLGYGLLALALYATYQFVGVFGAGTLVELLERRLFGEVLNPWATAFVDAAVPWAFARDLLVGPYGLITMALSYSFGLVLPIVATFFIAFGALEDSGYLPRLAAMANRSFRAMGLNGKAVLPMVLGLGCDTMATLTTRVLETPKERLIVILLLALGVPCSAQLAVTLALLQPLSPLATAVWAGVVLAVIFLVGRLAARALSGRSSDFVIEFPPLRLPRPANILRKTLARIEWYLKEAVPLFALGTLLLFLADRLSLLAGLQRAAEPLLVSGLGLPKETAEAFVIGFLRRDFGAAGLYRLKEAGALSPVQTLVAVVTMTLFIPCVANLLMIVRERGFWTALAVAAFVFPFAFAVGAALAGLLRAVPLPLL
jgi:ferrous iron transport protein B